MFEGIATDWKVAIRQMRLRSGFTAVVVLTLAFGIGINTAVFAALYKTVLHPIAFRDPDRLVAIHNRFPGLNIPLLGASPFDYIDLRERKELFSGVGVFYFVDFNRTGVDQPEKVNAIAVSPSLFGVLDVQPILGRTFTAEEENIGAPHCVVIRESYWRQEFAAAPDILQRTLDLNGEKYAIVGVMPDSFSFPNEVTQMWVPLQLKPSQLSHPAEPSYFLRMYARLAPGIDFETAERRMADVSKQLAASAASGFPRARSSWAVFLLPMEHDNDGTLRRWIAILFASVSSLLLIVCLNVAGLLLMRSYERSAAIAVRMALGASRQRIVRQLFVEALVLSTMSGALGLALAQLGIFLLTKYGPAGTLAVSGPIVWFGIALALLTSIICCVAPGWQSAHRDSTLALHSGTQRFSRRAAWQRPLIVIQIAVATILMLSGGLLVGSLNRLLNTNIGFDARNLTTLQISLPPTRYADPASRTEFWRRLLADVGTLPGVESASATTVLPFGYGENVNTFEVAGRPKSPVGQFAAMSNVLPRYFETMRIPLLRGRYLSERDGTDGLSVVAIDRAFAERHFAGEDPIGRQIKVAWGTFTIAGVVGSIKDGALDSKGGPAIYFPAIPLTDLSLVIRTSSSGSGIVKSVRTAVTRLDRNQPIYDVFPMEALVERSVRTRRFVMWLMTVFASSGTLLAALGLYGLLAYRVAMLRRELGIRKAIGATDQSIAWLICRGGLALVSGGIAVGSVGALAARRYIESQLYGVQFMDAAIWLAVVFVLILTGVLACAIPAWHAARTSPMEALHAE